MARLSRPFAPFPLQGGMKNLDARDKRGMTLKRRRKSNRSPKAIFGAFVIRV